MATDLGLAEPDGLAMTSEERQLFQELLKFVEEAELTSDEYAPGPSETTAAFEQEYPGLVASRQQRAALIRRTRNVLGLEEAPDYCHALSPRTRTGCTLLRGHTLQRTRHEAHAGSQDGPLIEAWPRDAVSPTHRGTSLD